MSDWGEEWDNSESASTAAPCFADTGDWTPVEATTSAAKAEKEALTSPDGKATTTASYDFGSTNDDWSSTFSLEGGDDGGKRFGGGKNCFNCNQPGHMSRNCPEPRKERRDGGGGGSNCYNCEKVGHLSRDCPEPRKKQKSSGGGGGGNCYNCEKHGHLSRDCPEPRNERRGGGRGGNCYNCEKPGHLSRDCPEPQKKRRSAGGGGGGDCFNCGKSGHFSRECPEPQKPKSKRSFGPSWSGESESSGGFDFGGTNGFGGSGVTDSGNSSCGFVGSSAIVPASVPDPAKYPTWDNSNSLAQATSGNEWASSGTTAETDWGEFTTAATEPDWGDSQPSTLSAAGADWGSAPKSRTTWKSEGSSSCQLNNSRSSVPSAESDWGESKPSEQTYELSTGTTDTDWGSSRSLVPISGSNWSNLKPNTQSDWDGSGTFGPTPMANEQADGSDWTEEPPTPVFKAAPLTDNDGSSDWQDDAVIPTTLTSMNSTSETPSYTGWGRNIGASWGQSLRNNDTMYIYEKTGGKRCFRSPLAGLYG